MTDPDTLWLEDDGSYPNSRLPVLLWRGGLAGGPDAIARAVRDHGWVGTWQDGIFDYHHYRATAHEVLGIGHGRVTVRFGGPRGETLDLAAGDVALLPAGTAHRNLGQSRDLIVVGAYPPGQRPDILRGEPGERPEADRHIASVPLPATNPVTGEPGPPDARTAPTMAPSSGRSVTPSYGIRRDLPVGTALVAVRRFGRSFRSPRALRSR